MNLDAAIRFGRATCKDYILRNFESILAAPRNFDPEVLGKELPQSPHKGRIRERYLKTAVRIKHGARRIPGFSSAGPYQSELTGIRDRLLGAELGPSARSGSGGVTLVAPDSNRVNIDRD